MAHRAPAETVLLEVLPARPAVPAWSSMGEVLDPFPGQGRTCTAPGPCDEESLSPPQHRLLLDPHGRGRRLCRSPALLGPLGLLASPSARAALLLLEHPGWRPGLLPQHLPEPPRPPRRSPGLGSPPGWAAPAAQRIPSPSAASAGVLPGRMLPQAPARHGSLLPGAELRRGKAQPAPGPGLRHWMAHEPRRRSPGGLGMVVQTPGCSGLGMPASAEGCWAMPGATGRCRAPSPAAPLPPRNPRERRWIVRSGTLTLAGRYLPHLRLRARPLLGSMQGSSRSAIPPDKSELTSAPRRLENQGGLLTCQLSQAQAETSSLFNIVLLANDSGGRWKESAWPIAHNKNLSLP